MIKRHLLKILLPALVLAFLFPASGAFAAYEPVNPQATNAVVGFDPVQGPAEDLEITWSVPAMSDDDSIVEYVYKWTKDGAPLTGAQLSRDVNDGVVSGEIDPPSVEKAMSFFAADDENTRRYFHVKTAYVSTSGPMLSNDVVVGPFNFDNVKPDGTLALDPEVAGQTDDSSSVNPVTVTVTVASVRTAKVYLSNTTTKPATAKADFIALTTVTHTVSEGAGSKTIYYWLEDSAGNVSDRKFLNFEMKAGKSMDPSGALQLSTGATQVFTISGKGADEKFDWSFVDANPADAASFVGGSQDVDQVTVKGEKEGTFKVTATSDLDAAVYTSGTVTVIKSFTPGDVNSDGAIDITDVLLTIDIIFGVKNPNPIEFAAANVDDSNDIIDITDLLMIIDIIFGK
jgi:hypothetical protein